MGIFYDEKEEEVRWLRVMAIIILFVVGLWATLSAFTTIPAGHRGVVLKFGAVQNVVLGEGFHTITPFIDSVKVMEVRTLKYEVVASAATRDLLDVTTKVAINYHLSENSVNKVYQSIGMDYQDRVIAPAVQEVVKAITAKFDAEKLITNRASVKQEIEIALRERMIERNINIESISITDFQFPVEFNNAITAKQTSTQLKLKAENDLQRIEVEAKQAVAVATGQSQSIQIINEELQRSPNYVNWLYASKWDGKLPQVTGGMPFVQIPIDKQQETFQREISSNTTTG